MSDKLVKKVHQIEWHRNGVGGVGFYAILFDGTGGNRMFATLYDEPGYCSVLSVPELSDPKVGVTFGQNSWRGDRYEGELRKAVDKQNGTNRIGPFSAIPL